MAKHVKKERSGQRNSVEYGLHALRMEDDSFVHIELRWLGTGECISSFELTGDQGMLTFDSRQATPIQFKRYEETEYAQTHSIEGTYHKELESLVEQIRSQKRTAIFANRSYSCHSGG